VLGHALDCGHDQSRWGRLLVEACIPNGTAIRFRAFSSDTLDDPDPLLRSAPYGESLSPILDAELTPLLSKRVWQQTLSDADSPRQELYRDPSARPLTPLPPDGFAHFDAPLAVAPGRYLWLVFELTGSRGKSPKLMSARAEYPGHDLLGKLPRTLWSQPESRDFLFRYLMPMAAMLDEWQDVSSQRQRLLDPRISPATALAWLAGFIGLALDPCWPEAVQRGLIAEAAPLFRTRGTVASLTRMLEILTQGGQVILTELFRLRGGGVVGNDYINQAQGAVLGEGFQVGGQIGASPTSGYTGAPEPADIADFDRFAHRFNVTLVASLDEAQLNCARRLIEMHKPAHTAFELCAAQTGIRVGVGAHVGIAAVIGESAGFSPAIVEQAALGAGFLLGRPALDDASAGGDAGGGA
jgi:phage tail-like protein